MTIAKGTTMHRDNERSGMREGALSRRHFIRGASAGAAGFAAVGCGGGSEDQPQVQPAPQPAPPAPEPASPKVEYVTLGQTGMKVSKFLGDRMAGFIRTWASI